MCFAIGYFAPAQAILFLGKHNDRATFRRFVRKTRKLCGVCELLLRNSRESDKVYRLPVSQSNCARFVEQ